MTIDRLKYILQTFFFQIMLGAAVAAFLGVFAYAVSLEGKNPVPADVKAQFKASLGKAGATGANLSAQNLSSREVAEQLIFIVAESLSFTAADYQRTVGKAAAHFTPQGYDQYKSFLNSSGLYAALQNHNLRTSSFTENEPLEINSLSQNGVYKWRMQAPVAISFSPLSRSLDKQELRNQRFNLDVQFTRVKDPADPNAIKIEIWNIQPAR